MSAISENQRPIRATGTAAHARRPGAALLYATYVLSAAGLLVSDPMRSPAHEQTRDNPVRATSPVAQLRPGSPPTERPPELASEQHVETLPELNAKTARDPEPGQPGLTRNSARDLKRRIAQQRPSVERSADQPQARSVTEPPEPALRTDGVSENQAQPQIVASDPLRPAHAALGSTTLTPVSGQVASKPRVAPGAWVTPLRPQPPATTLEQEAAAGVALDSPLLRQVRTLLGEDDTEGWVLPQAAVYDRRAKFDVLQARSGEIAARGFVARGARGPSGSLLISTPLADIGVKADWSEVQLQLMLSESLAD